MPEWDAEIDVDAAWATRLIATQFPELVGEPVRLLDAGWDNAVYRVGERWAFRFPRRAIAIPGVEREIEILGRLAPNLPLPIPEPRFVGVATDDYPWPWFGTAHLQGVELAEAATPDERRVGLGRAVGAFLRVLHGSEMSRRVGTGLPIDPMRRADMGMRVPFAHRRLENLAEAGLWTRTAAIDALLDDAAGLPPPPRTVVVHGDLHVRHVLVGPADEPTGIIDWGDVATGDPSLDLSIAYAAFEGPARAALLAAYGRVDLLTELRARVIGGFLSAALAQYAADRGLDPLLRESLRGLERVVA